MITADPVEIRDRRERDVAATGRLRDINETNIEQDQNLNVQAFEVLIASGQLPSHSEILQNAEGQAHILGSAILADIVES